MTKRKRQSLWRQRLQLDKGGHRVEKYPANSPKKEKGDKP